MRTVHKFAGRTGPTAGSGCGGRVVARNAEILSLSSADGRANAVRNLLAPSERVCVKLGERSGVEVTRRMRRWRRRRWRAPRREELHDGSRVCVAPCQLVVDCILAVVAEVAVERWHAHQQPRLAAGESPHRGRARVVFEVHCCR